MSALVKEQKSDQSILVGDGFHLSEKGGEWAANEIRKQLLATSNKDKVKQVKQRREPAPTTSQQTTPPHRPQTPHQAHQHTPTPSSPEIDILRTQIVVIPPGIGKHVVGKQGKVISAIQKRHNVEIITAPPRENDKTLISITGPSHQNKKAEAEIIDIILDQLEGEKKSKSKKEDHERNICRYNQEGKCRYGDKCWRIHLPKHNTNDTRRNRSRSRSPAKRSRSRPRARTPLRRTENRPRSPHKRTSSRPRTSISPPRKYTRRQDPPEDQHTTETHQTTTENTDPTTHVPTTENKKQIDTTDPSIETIPGNYSPHNTRTKEVI